jgi:hypothetical protein
MTISLILFSLLCVVVTYLRGSLEQGSDARAMLLLLLHQHASYISQI